MFPKSFSTPFLLVGAIAQFATCLVTLQLAAFAVSPQELLASGHVDELIQTLQPRLSTEPRDAESNNLICRAYFSLEEWDRAIPTCERAVNFDPQNSRYHLWLGRLYGEKADRAGFLKAAGLAKKVR